MPWSRVAGLDRLLASRTIVLAWWSWRGGGCGFGLGWVSFFYAPVSRNRVVGDLLLLILGILGWEMFLHSFASGWVVVVWRSLC